ncbi:MAG: isoprenylcysteine carboxylmethyltransferase family protein [Spirochaetes bacterium]|nr:isoprenylcysteine carboxylmethyltransferase family protein [Spirochaetota bacterium]
MGLILFTAALFNFGSSWRVGIDKAHAGELVTRGVFSITRNPIFLFIDLYFLGTFLVYGNIFFLVSSIIAIASSHIQILEEEKFLGAHYGSRYLDYKARVPRY